jgi:Flp pilus assembly protein TadG
MSVLRKLAQGTRRLWRNERGAVAPMVGVAAITLIGAVGLAVDIGRGQVALSKLQSSLDAAGLAAGAVVGQQLDEETLEAEARKYFDANFAGQTIDASIVDFDLDLSEDETIVTLSAKATLPTTFMLIFGQKKIDVAARSEITREMTGLEVALVLDVTGSMCDPCQKLADLKTASNDLLDVLYGDETELDDLWIGIVPFSQAVNVGTEHADWTADHAQRAAKDNCIGTTNVASTPHCPTTGNNGLVTMSSIDAVTRPPISTRTDPVTLVDDWMVGPTGNSLPSNWKYANHSWRGCVEERFATDNDVTNVLPEDDPFLVYFYPDMVSGGTNLNVSNNWINNSTGTGNNDGRKLNTSSDRANKGCPVTPITPLTNQKQTLIDAIDLLEANGNTHINVGAAWGWRLLSREWKAAWGGDMATNDLPKAWDDEESQKAVVIMTDGKNTMTRYTAYGNVISGELGASNLDNDNDPIFEASLNAKTAAVCNSMKQAGIVVYTVLFQTTEDSVKDMLRDCASKTVFFFDTTTGEDLATAFKTIGDSLSKLRVSR